MGPTVGPGESDEEAARRREVALMDRVASGDLTAFRELYEMHAPAVTSLLHRLSGDPGLAEDLVQEVFVKAWRAAGRWRPEAPVRTWLLAIARRHGWNAGAKRSRRRGLWRQGGDPDAVASGADPAAGAERAEEGRRLEAAVLRLSAPLRLAFVLVRLEGLSLLDAAEVAGVPVGTVKSRLAAAEARLRRSLAEGAP